MVCWREDYFERGKLLGRFPCSLRGATGRDTLSPERSDRDASMWLLTPRTPSAQGVWADRQTLVLGAITGPPKQLCLKSSHLRASKTQENPYLNNLRWSSSRQMYLTDALELLFWVIRKFYFQLHGSKVIKCLLPRSKGIFLSKCFIEI